VNITVVSPTGPGFLTTWDGVSAMPNASTLNYTAGEAAVPNLAVVPTALTDGALTSFAFYTQASAHVVIDVMGYFDDSGIGGLRFRPQAPMRIVDTRTGLGAARLGTATTATILTPNPPAVPGTAGLALNVTAVAPTAPTYVSVWAAGVPGVAQPVVSNLNPGPGQIIPNAVYTLIGPTDEFNIYNNAGSTDIVADVVGTFYDAGGPPGGPVGEPWQIVSVF
jgi:hypothetical protein